MTGSNAESVTMRDEMRCYWNCLGNSNLRVGNFAWLIFINSSIFVLFSLNLFSDYALKPINLTISGKVDLTFYYLGKLSIFRYLLKFGPSPTDDNALVGFVRFISRMQWVMNIRIEGDICVRRAWALGSRMTHVKSPLFLSLDFLYLYSHSLLPYSLQIRPYLESRLPLPSTLQQFLLLFYYLTSLAFQYVKIVCFRCTYHSRDWAIHLLVRRTWYKSAVSYHPSLMLGAGAKLNLSKQAILFRFSLCWVGLRNPWAAYAQSAPLVDLIFPKVRCHFHVVGVRWYSVKQVTKIWYFNIGVDARRDRL